MASFGKLLADCRDQTKLTQKDLGDVIKKSPGFISKLEKGNKKVKVPPVFYKSVVIDLFKREGVAEEKLKALGTAWDNSLRSGGSNNITEEPTIELILETLDELGESDRKAFIEDMKQMILMWRNYHIITADFQADQLSFSSAEYQYGLQLEEKGQKLGIFLDPRLRLERARHRRYLARNEDANTDLIDALESVNRIDDPKLKLKILIELGDFYRRSDDLNQSLNYYRQADELCDVHNIKNAGPKVRIASCYLVAGDPMTAMPYGEEGLKIARVTKDAHLARKAVEYIAWAKGMFGYYNEALQLSIDSHMRAIIDGIHQKDLAKSSCYLGDSYFLCGLYKEAESNFQESLGYIKHIDEINKGVAEKEIFIKSWVLLGLARTYLHVPGKQRAADECLRESREIGKNINDMLTIGRSDELRGQMNMAIGDFEKARTCFQSAGLSFSKAGISELGNKTRCNPYYLTGLELNFTELEFLTGNIMEALKHAEDAHTTAGQFSLAGYDARARLWKARILLSTQDTQFEQVLGIIHEAIAGSLPYGVSHLQSILATLDAHILGIQKTNAELALHLVRSMIIWRESLYALKPSDDQIKEFDRWFTNLDELHSDWTITLKVDNLLQKHSKKSGYKN
jgi:tetratricopeptide (TPR) repeat protein